MRTNIDIDDSLMQQTMQATGTTTKRAAVEAAMRHTIRFKAAANLKSFFGKVDWRGPDDDWFATPEELAASQTRPPQKFVTRHASAVRKSTGTKG